MRFLWVEISNFLSFGGIQRVDLNNRGLLAVFGLNKDTQSADSNGAGKTAILEAITWVIYGETVRGYKADEVVNIKIGHGCIVKLGIDDDGKNYTITRTRKNNAKKPNDLILEVDGQDISGGIITDTQEMIDTIIGMDFKTFTQSVMLSNGIRPFSLMTDKEQKDVLEDILQIDQLSRAKDKIKTKTIERQNDLANVRLQLQNLNVRISDFWKTHKDLSVQRDQFFITIMNRKIDLRKQRGQIEVQLEELHNQHDLSVLIALQEDLQKKSDFLHGTLLAVQQRELEIIRSFSVKKQELAKNEGALVGRLKQLYFDSSQINSVVGKQCPVCKQVLSPNAADCCVKIIKNEKDLIEEKLEELSNSKKKLNEQENNSLSEIIKTKKDIQNEQSLIQPHIRDVSEKIQKRKIALDMIQQLEDRIKQINNDIDSIDNNSNPYVRMISQIESDIQKLINEVRIFSYQEKSINIELAHLSYWNCGFGNQGLKSFILDSIIPFLTQRAQYYADIISGGDIQIEFATQTQLKSGEWKEQFQVKVINKQGADVYQGNSDGEKRRIDVAVGWALGDLAASRAKKPIRFKALDEPFESLDETGEDAVIKLLHDVLSKYETIMCITHSTHLKNLFPEEMTVVKSGGLSFIQ